MENDTNSGHYLSTLYGEEVGEGGAVLRDPPESLTCVVGGGRGQGLHCTPEMLGKQGFQSL